MRVRVHIGVIENQMKKNMENEMETVVWVPTWKILETLGLLKGVYTGYRV